MMRTLFLLLVAATTQAQDASFFFDPTIGSPAGGDVIRFVANPPIDFRCAGCGPPQVFFGGIASPAVTVIDSRTFTAVTPPHAEGVVDVTMNFAGASYTTPRKFGYARARDPLLVPVAIETPGAFGTRWTTDIFVYNDSDEAVNLLPEVCFFIGAAFPCGDALIVPAHTSMQVPPRGNSYAPEMYLNPPNDVRDRLHFNVRVRNAANPNDLGVEIPIVLSSGFRSERVVLPNVPVNSRFRSLLRVYNQNSFDSIAVRIYDARSGVLLTRRDTGLRPVPTDTPLRFSFGFFDLLNDPALTGHDTVRIEIEEPGALLWAMLTLTENATQRVTVLTSQ